MVPSKMELKISTGDYNNTILIATPDLKSGINTNVNLLQENTTKIMDDDPPIATFANEMKPKDPMQVDDEHEDNKKSLAIGAVVRFSFIYLSFQIII